VVRLVWVSTVITWVAIAYIAVLATKKIARASCPFIIAASGHCDAMAITNFQSRWRPSRSTQDSR
jgi:hypothetical protein